MGGVATLFDQFMYEHFLPGATKELADVAAIPTIDLLCELVCTENPKIRP